MMQNPMVQQMMQQMLNDPQALEQVRIVLCRVVLLSMKSICVVCS